MTEIDISKINRYFALAKTHYRYRFIKYQDPDRWFYPSGSMSVPHEILDTRNEIYPEPSDEEQKWIRPQLNVKLPHIIDIGNWLIGSNIVDWFWINYQVDFGYYDYGLFFKNETDAINFSLRWL